jgi:hypothetical protein
MVRQLSALLFFFATLSIGMTQAQELTLEATSVFSTRCAGSSTGMVVLETFGGTAPVEISTNLNLTTLQAGNYQFIAIDSLGATATVDVVILDHPGVCGCVYPGAFNYSTEAEIDNGSCVFASDPSCLGDIVPDGVVGTNDLLQLLSEFGQFCN